MPSEHVIVSTWAFGDLANRVAAQCLRAGDPPLDALEKGINAVEDDPEVTSVGYGGEPNADGFVELDAAIMRGSDLAAGAVAALRDVRRPISVARQVMERSKHVMLAGDGARRFALAHGFPSESLAAPGAGRQAESHDTIGTVLLTPDGHVYAGCSTSGLAGKLPGRVGDSPIIGAGLYADDRAGAAAATGLGEHMLRCCTSFLVVELMRAGATPDEAIRRTLKRMADRIALETVGLIAVRTDGLAAGGSNRQDFESPILRLPAPPPTA